MAALLSSFSYTVMAVVGRDGGAAGDLVQMASGGAPFFWTGAPSHVLRTARRLADEGYLSVSTERAKTRPRTIYKLTDLGHEVFRDWLAQPSGFPRIQHEAAIRLWSSDLGDTDAVLASLLALQEELPELEALVDLYEQRAPSTPHREKANLLALSLARRLIDAHRSWIDDVEAAYQLFSSSFSSFRPEKSLEISVFSEPATPAARILTFPAKAGCSQVSPLWNAVYGGSRG